MDKQLIKHIFKQTVIWTLAFMFWSLMRNFGHEVVDDIPDPNFSQWVALHLVIGAIAGLLFGMLEFTFGRRFMRNIPFGKAVLIGSFSYLVAVALLLVLGIRVFAHYVHIELTHNEYMEYLFSKTSMLFVMYCFIVGFLVDFFNQVDKKFGPGNLMKMLKGEFYHPKEDERVFMFLDLKSSTSIAEQLGHIAYSQLIQDCFLDLDVVENFKAEIYQYVGDEAVLTWKKDKGLENANCLRAFFAFKDKLESKADYYNTKYGVVPEFKAGLNVGKITIAEVGEVKREIAYHGDAINTAARIQDKCNELGKSLLISESLELALKDGQRFFLRKPEGNILLKGKASGLNVYSVEILD